LHFCSTPEKSFSFSPTETFFFNEKHQQGHEGTRTELLAYRVTRLGEFSPIGGLITLQCFKNLLSSINVLASLSHGNSYVFILTKNGFGNVLGDFLNKLIWSPYQLNIPHFCS
jgi:hypothetical protein